MTFIFISFQYQFKNTYGRTSCFIISRSFVYCDCISIFILFYYMMKVPPMDISMTFAVDIDQ